MSIDSINEYIKKHLSEKRQVHTEGVRKKAIYLAVKYGADADKAEIAALFHDIYRGRKNEELNKLIDQLEIDEKYKDNPNLSHGKIAAAIMKRDWDIDDNEILDAVKYHTTGRKGMTLLDKVIFVADAIEPARNYPGVERLRELSELDLDRACLESIEGTISLIEESNSYLDLDTVAARDDLLNRRPTMKSQGKNQRKLE